MRRSIVIAALLCSLAIMVTACSPDPPAVKTYIGPGNNMTGYGNEVVEMHGYLVCAGEQEVVSTGPYEANEGITYNDAYVPQIDRLLESPDASVTGAFGYIQHEDAQWAYGLMIQLADITRNLNEGEEFTRTPRGEAFKVPKKCWVEVDGETVIMGERPFGVESTNASLEGEPALTAGN
jgi:hypothetical protein